MLAHHFIAITLEEAEKLDWEALVHNLESMMLGSFTFNAKGGTVEYNKSELGGDELTVDPKSKILEEGRNTPITFGEFINGIIRKDRV